jgi:hypothetical protein
MGIASAALLGPDRVCRKVCLMLQLAFDRLKSASLLSRTAAAVAAATVGTAALLGVFSLAVVSITESIAGEPASVESAPAELDGEPVVIATEPKRSGLTPAPRSGTAQNRAVTSRQVAGGPSAASDEDP